MVGGWEVASWFQISLSDLINISQATGLSPLVSSKNSPLPTSREKRAALEEGKPKMGKPPE
jgi:hypothetical protein